MPGNKRKQVLPNSLGTASEQISQTPPNRNRNSDTKQLFELWGYSIIDSEYLQKEFEKQARAAYSVGDYKLGKLDEHGQRISIEIQLKRLNGNGSVAFLSGWMMYPNGRIILTTPYGGK